MHAAKLAAAIRVLSSEMKRARYLTPLAVLIAACHSVGPADSHVDARAPVANAPPASPSKTTRVHAEPAARPGSDPGGVGQGTPLEPQSGHELAAFAGGCFWGVEDVFRHVPGVTATAVGYTGGHQRNPRYGDVSGHGTGHAETVLVEFDPKRVSYAKLVHVFFANHDPTTLNRQGPDVGDQYRSHVFTFSEAQRNVVRKAMAKMQGRLDAPLTTRVSPIGAFYKAEAYHQQYAERTGHHGCASGGPKGIDDSI